jgi:probable F420-dependent oxidoreductase
VSASRFPIRFGVGADPLGAESLAEWVALAARCESLGYSSALIGDHFEKFVPAGGADPFLALAAVGAVTDRIALGTVVLGNDYRHPAVVAKSAATLDALFPGRIELGIGAGWYGPEYSALGIPFDPPGDRIDRLDEALGFLRRAWSGERFDLAGEHYTIADYAATPVPAVGPRLLVGGGSAKVLRLAGRHADIVGIHPSTAATDSVADTSIDRTLAKIGWVREGAGARFDGIELQMACSFHVTDGSRAALEDAAAAAGTTVDLIEASAMHLVGDLAGIARKLRERRDALGISYFIVPSTSVDDLASVVADLTGA